MVVRCVSMWIKLLDGLNTPIMNTAENISAVFCFYRRSRGGNSIIALVCVSYPPNSRYCATVVPDVY